MSDKQVSELLSAMDAAKKKATSSKESALKFLEDADLLKYFPPTTASTEGKKKE